MCYGSSISFSPPYLVNVCYSSRGSACHFTQAQCSHCFAFVLVLYLQLGISSSLVCSQILYTFSDFILFLNLIH